VSATPRQDVVTLSQIERDSPTTANAEARDFNGLACWSIAEIRLISPNVTTPMELAADALRAELGEEPDNDVLMAESNRLVFDIRTNDYTAAAIVDGNVGLGDDALYGRDVMPPEDRPIH
jgi:hypothetical protein